MGDKVMTPDGILSFPALFEARAAQEGAEPRFSINIIFDEVAQRSQKFKDLQAAIEKEAMEFFQGKPPKGWRNPIRDAGEKDYAGYEDGSVYVQAWSKTKPGLVGPNLEEIDVPSDVFAGQKVRATVRPFGYNKQGNKGVGLSLQNVMIVKYDMPRLDGRTSAKQDFNGLAEETEDADAPF